MKPHLLLMLLLALPPLICNLLACENAEAPESSTTTKACTSPKVAAVPAVTPASHATAPESKAPAKPTKSGSAPSRFAPWSMM